MKNMFGINSLCIAGRITADKNQKQRNYYNITAFRTLQFLFLPH